MHEATADLSSGDQDKAKAVAALIERLERQLLGHRLHKGEGRIISTCGICGSDVL